MSTSVQVHSTNQTVDGSNTSNLRSGNNLENVAGKKRDLDSEETHDVMERNTTENEQLRPRRRMKIRKRTLDRRYASDYRRLSNRGSHRRRRHNRDCKNGAGSSAAYCYEVSCPNSRQHKHIASVRTCRRDGGQIQRVRCVGNQPWRKDCYYYGSGRSHNMCLCNFMTVRAVRRAGQRGIARKTRKRRRDKDRIRRDKNRDRAIAEKRRLDRYRRRRLR